MKVSINIDLDWPNANIREASHTFGHNFADTLDDFLNLAEIKVRSYNVSFYDPIIDAIIPMIPQPGSYDSAIK